MKRRDGSDKSAAAERPAADALPEAPPVDGLTCRKCGCHHFRVVDTRRDSARDKEGGGCIRRRRECRHCGWRVWTTETIEDASAEG